MADTPDTRLDGEAPWDDEPRNGGCLWALCTTIGTLLLFGSALVLSVVLTLMFLGSLMAGEMPTGRWEDPPAMFSTVLLIFTILAVGWFATFMLYRLFVRRYWRSRSVYIEQGDESDSVVLLPIGLFQTLAGPGSPEFAADGLCIHARPRINDNSFYILMVIMAIASNIVSHLVHDNFWRTIAAILLVLVLVIGLVVLTVFQRRKQQAEKDLPNEFWITPDILRNVTCYGPIAHIRLEPASFWGVRKVVLYVKRGWREWFFREFERTFPDMLPPEYEAALTKLLQP